MDEALCSILCSEESWCADPYGQFIQFKNDGTGEVRPQSTRVIPLPATDFQQLTCRGNLHYWIHAEFEWKSLKKPEQPSLASPDHPITNYGTSRAEVLGQLDLEITLTKRMAASAREWADENPVTAKSMNERWLGEDAFRTKSYTVRIERGNFIYPWSRPQEWDTPRYSLRLLFDVSPYPPYAEWKDPPFEPDQGLFWEQVEFVGRDAPDSACRQRPMNGRSAWSWDGCVVS